MIRVFFDTSVLIAGLASKTGASHAVLMMAEIGLIQMVISQQVILECQRNLIKKVSLSLSIFEELLISVHPEILSDCSLEESHKWITIIEAKDAPILATAILGKCPRLLTLNTKDFTQEVAMATGLIIQTPSQFIQEVRGIVTNNL